MIVVDTNIIAYLFLPSPFTSDVERLFKQDQDWIVPLLWRSEFRNILSGYIRKQSLKKSDALKIMYEAENLFSNREFEIGSEEVLELITSSTCSAYDCEFVALAKSMNTKLVTADKQILREFPEISVSFRAFKF